MSPLLALSTLLLALQQATPSTAYLTSSIRMPSPYRDDTHIGFLASVVGVSEGKTTLALHFDDQTDLQTAGYMIDHKPNTMTFQRDAFEAVSTQSAPSATVTYGCSFASSGGVCSFVEQGAEASAHTYAIEEEDIATYQVVITAGTEKLSATAGATPHAGAPAPTGTLAVSLHRGQNVVPVETGAPTAAPAAPAEGAAGALAAVHPLVLGAGAALVAMLV